MEEWRQGDYFLGTSWFVYRFDPSAPLASQSRDLADPRVDLCEIEVKGFVLLTQSCDVVRDPLKRPFLQVAPLVEVDEIRLQQIKHERRPQYVFVPDLEDSRLVGDLDRVMTVEKPVALGWDRGRGCRTDHECRRFAAALARKSSRPAFPDHFSSVVEDLVDRLTEKHNKESDEGRALRALVEIRAVVASSRQATDTELFFWFIRDEEDATFEGISWDELLDKWLSLVDPGDKYIEVNGEVVTLKDMTGYDYVHSDPLDLEHLSGRQL